MKKILTIIVALACIVSAIVVGNNFVINNSKLEKNNSQTEQAPTPNVELSYEDQIYEELTGSVINNIDEDEKNTIKTLINELINLEKNNEPLEKKVSVYKNIVEILDKITLKNINESELNSYKEYFNKVQSAAQPNILANYNINSDGSISPVLNISSNDNKKYTKLWEKSKQIIPFEYLKEINKFSVFKVNEKDGYMAGFMQPIDGIWTLGVECEPKDEILPYILIHEFGHFISLKNSQVKMDSNIQSIKANGSEILNNFINTTIPHISEEFNVINDNNNYLFFARHKNDFITMYASRNVLEDFAESFARFISDDKRDTTRLKLKYEFFNNNSYFVEIKDKILSNLKANNIKINNCTQ